MKLADRISRLGTETAFAVSAEAAAFAAEGNKVYPFHLGDINIKTPVNVMEASVKAMQDGKTGYCPNAGCSDLRAVLAEDVSASRAVSYSMENVAIQPGGKPTIGKFILAMMNPGDEVLYPNPGYPIYESMIEFHGGKAVPYTYKEGAENFEIDLEMLERQITPRTRILVLNDLQNPTGAECSPAEMERLAEVVLKHDLYVLSDEAYFDIRYEGKSRSIVSLPGMAERCVILYTFSKKFAMTGWRLGAPFLVQGHGVAFGTQGHLYGISQGIYAFFQGVPEILSEYNLFSHLLSSSFYLIIYFGRLASTSLSRRIIYSTSSTLISVPPYLA